MNPNLGKTKKSLSSWTILSWNTRKFTQENWGDSKGLTLGRSWDLSETPPKTPGMSCHEGRFHTCDTGGSCRSSWSLCTTSVKSSAWKQTTSLVIRGWSLLGKTREIQEFWKYLSYRAFLLSPAESFIESMTCSSVTLCTKPQHFSIVYYFGKEG